MMSTGMPAFSITLSAPMCAIPLAPPPLSTTATRFRCGCCAQIATPTVARRRSNTIFFIGYSRIRKTVGACHRQQAPQPCRGQGLFIHAVHHKPMLGHLLVFRAWQPIVGIRIDADAAARGEISRHFYVLRSHQPDEVFHDNVHTVFVKVAVVAEAEEVKFQAFALYHTLCGYVTNADFGKVGLPCDGA